MTSDDRLYETIVRGYSIMCRFQDGMRTPATSSIMSSAVGLLTTKVAGAAPMLGDVVLKVLAGVKFNLLERYGLEVGGRLNAEFLGAYTALPSLRGMIRRKAARNASSS